jgi:hypothetical protein
LEIQEKKYKTFFEPENRRKYGRATSLDSLLTIFEKTFTMFQDKLFQTPTVKEHPFYQLFSSKFKLQSNPPLTDLDNVFIQYLQDVKDKTNSEYYTFIFQFLIIFREFINKIKKDEITEGNDYTQINNAELIPDFCNDFVIDFMEPEDYFNLDATELIEILQHLCYWLYEHSYTTSRLTLI